MDRRVGISLIASYSLCPATCLRDGSRRPDQEEETEDGVGSDYIQVASSSQGQIGIGCRLGKSVALPGVSVIVSCQFHDIDTLLNYYFI